MHPLTLKEQTVMDEIMSHYFTPLQLTHWEGVEEEHKRQLRELIVYVLRIELLIIMFCGYSIVQ